LYQFLISIATRPAFSNKVLRKVNSYSVLEGDYVEEDEMNGECRTLGGEEKDTQGLWMENLKVRNCMDNLDVDGRIIYKLI
jgi:hypothetical protein